MSRAWCKVSAHLDSHPKVRRAGNLGRQIFEFALRRNAELDGAGVIPADHMEPDYLADVLMLSPEQATAGIQRAVHAKLLAPCADELSGHGPDTKVTVRTGHAPSSENVTICNYAIVGWDDEWGKTPLSEAERKRLQRARQRDSSMSRNCPDTKVTNSDCPDSHGSDQRRSEKKDLISADQVSGGDPESSAGKKHVGRRKPADPTPSESASIDTVLAKLSAVSGIQLRGAQAHVRLILARLREGITELELRAVVAYCGEEWKSDPKMQRYLRPETLFGPETIARYLDPARTLYRDRMAEAARDEGKSVPQTQHSLELVR